MAESVGRETYLLIRRSRTGGVDIVGLSQNEVFQR